MAEKNGNLPLQEYIFAFKWADGKLILFISEMAASTPGDSATVTSEPGAIQKLYKKYSEVQFLHWPVLFSVKKVSEAIKNMTRDKVTRCQCSPVKLTEFPSCHWGKICFVWVTVLC